MACKGCRVWLSACTPGCGVHLTPAHQGSLPPLFLQHYNPLAFYKTSNEKQISRSKNQYFPLNPGSPNRREREE